MREVISDTEGRNATEMPQRAGSWKCMPLEKADLREPLPMNPVIDQAARQLWLVFPNKVCSER